VVIPAYWNGPPGSANGGYTCGVLARLLETPAAEVTLRAPPPLETALRLERDEGSLRLLDGETVVAEGRGAPPPQLEPLRSVGLDEAKAASEAGLRRWASAHPFPTCVVCGPERGDGMRVFPGPLEDGLFAAPWRGEPSCEHVWAALDCPTSAPVLNYGGGPPIVLARLHAHIERIPAAGEELVVVSWGLGGAGRKREAASALLAADGSILARARALWIELRRD